MNDLTVAQTILAQLGGARFMTMTGAHSFVGSASTLTFGLPLGRDGKRIAKVRIKLGDDDLYSVSFYRKSKLELIPVAVVSGVYCDALQEVFTRHTGLETHL